MCKYIERVYCKCKKSTSFANPSTCFPSCPSVPPTVFSSTATFAGAEFGSKSAVDLGVGLLSSSAPPVFRSYVVEIDDGTANVEPGA